MRLRDELTNQLQTDPCTLVEQFPSRLGRLGRLGGLEAWSTLWTISLMHSCSHAVIHANRPGLDGFTAYKLRVLLEVTAAADADCSTFSQPSSPVADRPTGTAVTCGLVLLTRGQRRWTVCSQHQHYHSVFSVQFFFAWLPTSTFFLAWAPAGL